MRVVGIAGSALVAAGSAAIGAAGQLTEKLPANGATVDWLWTNFSVAWTSLILGVFLASFVLAVMGPGRAKPFLNESVQHVQLVEKRPVTHNTIRLRFALPKPNYRLGLPAGKHIKIYAPNVIRGKVAGMWNGKHDACDEEVRRPYTPVTGDEVRGSFDLVVKVYRGNGDTSSPHCDGGKMSQYLDQYVKVGDFVAISGPVGFTRYHGFGRFTRGNAELVGRTRIGMIAGGTGITPMLQIIHSITSNPRDKETVFWLLFANQTPDDILLRDTFDEFAALYPHRLHVWYTVDRIPENYSAASWKYSVGYITKDMIIDHLPGPSSDSVMLLCGPAAMTRNHCLPMLQDIGWASGDILFF